MDLKEILTNEDIIIRQIFKEAFLQTKVSTHLDEEYFSENSNKEIIKYTNAYISKYKKFPDAKELYFFIPDTSNAKLKFYNIMASKFDNMNKALIHDTVETFFRNKKTYNVITEVASLFSENRLTPDEIGFIVKRLQECVNFSLQTNLGLSAVKDVDEVLKRLKHSNVAIPSSSKFIRQATGDSARSGGWMRKALSLFVGQPNIGKTINLCNEAAYAYKCGYNVVYITLELAEEFILKRIYANVADIKQADVILKSVDEITSAFKNNTERGKTHGEIFVTYIKPSIATALEIENYIHEIEQENNLKIDLVVVDYIGKMKPIKKKNAMNFAHTLYTLGNDVSEQLRELAQSLEVAVLTASQMNKEGYDELKVGMKKTAGSSALNDNADLMIFLSQDADLKRLSLFCNTLSKNRFGPNGASYLSGCEYDFMRVRDATPQQYKDYLATTSKKEQKIEGFEEIADKLLSNSEELVKVAISQDKPHQKTDVADPDEDFFNEKNDKLLENNINLGNNNDNEYADALNISLP